MHSIPRDLLYTIAISSLLILGCQGEPAACARYSRIGWCQQAHIKRACTISCSDNGGSGPPSATWSNWTIWSACTVTCGSGTQRRTRTCSVAGQCPGSPSGSRSCSKPSCPTGPPSATWSNWTIWSACPVTCGSGTQRRTRICSVAGQCSGSQSGSRSCSKPSCPTGDSPSCSGYKKWCSLQYIKDACPITCAEGSGSSSASWHNWGPWSYCTPTCGAGSQTRSRTCSIPRQCTGSSSDTRECNGGSCSGIWGNWSDWTPCSVTCGPGEQKRDRTCSTGGCSGESSQSRVCNEPPCFSGWLPWEKWGQCDRACGPGVRRRLRVCPTNQCTGSSTSTESCNLRSCTYESAYTQCSQTCGDGIKRKLQGSEYVTQHCNLKNCPEVSCVGDYESRHKNPASCCKKTQTCYRPAVERRKLFYRVIGGADSELGDWPWMVFIRQPDGVCGGALISSKFIVTAAHCLYLRSGVPVAAKDLTVRLGLVYLETPGLKSYPIINIFIYPHYNSFDNDIAILELKDHVPFNDQIQPLCLPHGEVVPHDTICVVMGWGVSIIGVRKVTKILQNAPIKVFDPEVCVDRYRSGYRASIVSHLKRRRGYICAGDLVNQIDSCNGDSGSPLACQRCANCGWFAAGVVSYGPDPCANKKDPGVYTSVVHYQEWIYHVTGIPKQNLSC